MTRSDGQVAGALADAFLHGEWTRPALVDRGAAVLGGRRRWLGPLVREVLAAYRDPPRDRPRELAAFVALTAPFRTACETAARTRRPLRATRLLPTPTLMGRGRWPVPPLDDLAALADLTGLDQGRLAWLSDPAHRLRRVPSGPLHLHRYRWLPRPGREPRLLEVPLPRLRAVQRLVLDRVLAAVPVHDAAHGFVAGRSAVTGARLHLRTDVVVTLDLSAFFASVRAGRVYGILREAGYPEPVAHCMTGLCTTATPVRVISAMPPGGDPQARAHLRRRLAQAHLAQGAPTSPQLANLVAHRLDVRLAGYARSAGATYTRYADDLTFSCPQARVPGRQRGWADAVVRAAGRIARDEGYIVNDSKTRVQRRGGRQSVTGIVVNEATRVPRRDYDRLKSILHNAARHGAAGQNRDGVADFRAHLTGRVAWVAQLDPERGRRLRATLDRIDWS